MTSKIFDIGQSNDLAIFTNDHDDVFSADNNGPNYLLNHGNEINLSDTGNIENLVSDIKIDFPDDSPIDFVKDNFKQQAQKIERVPKQRMESFSSSASDSTIDAEPVYKSIPKQKENIKQQSHSSHIEQDNDVNILENFNFDEILDNKKLKKSDDISTTGDTQSTVKGFEYIPEPKHYTKTTTTQPTYSQPAYSQPAHSQPAYSQPTYSQPAYSQPANSQDNTDIPKYLTEDEEKLDLLLKLQRMEKKKGIKLSKNFTFRSPIDEIRMEYKHQSHMLETESNIRYMKMALMVCTNGIEKLNEKFDPVGAELTGWSESVSENIMDFDGIFEELAQKYTGQSQMAPELKLLFALGGSAIFFHISQKMLKMAGPQMGNVLREHPDLVKGLFGAFNEASKRSASMGNQQVNIPVASNVGQMDSPGIDFRSMLSQMGLGGDQFNGFAKAYSNGPPPPVATKDIPEPSVTDIYRKMVTTEQNVTDDILSTTSVESERSIGSGNKKAIISPSKKKHGGNVLRL